MRDLCRTSLLPRSLLGGAVVSAASAPHVVTQHPEPSPFLLAALFVLATVIWQIVLAWTPTDVHRLRGPVPWAEGRTFTLLAFATVGVAAACHVYVDPRLRSVLPEYGAADFRELWLCLPWLASFQALFLVAFAFAFAYRFSRSRAIGVAGVVLLSELVGFLQARDLPGSTLAAVTVLAGVKALLLGLCYVRTGFAGVGLASALMHSRFAIQLLAANG